MKNNSYPLRAWHLQTPFQRALVMFTILCILLVSPLFSCSTLSDPAGPKAVFQPTAPYYATFYYPWYQSPTVDDRWSYWPDHGNQPPDTWFSHYLPDVDPTIFDPSRELYSSFDPDVLRWQLEKMAEARLEVAISSWHGPGHKTDTALRFMLTDIMPRMDNPYPNLRWAIYYEREGYADPSPSEIANDLNYIAMEFALKSAYLHIDDRPVIFVYADAADSLDMARRWKEANREATDQFHVVLKVFSGYMLAESQPDGWHQYAPAERVSAHPPDSFAISPGFWLDDGSTARLSHNIDEFRIAVSQLVAAETTWKLVTTWNEWGEGTSIEPGDPVWFNPQTGHDEFDINAPAFQNLYIDVLAEFLPAIETGLEIPPTPTPTPNPGGALPPPAFSFAAAGDHGANQSTEIVLRALRDSDDELTSATPISTSLTVPAATTPFKWCTRSGAFHGIAACAAEWLASGAPAFRETIISVAASSPNWLMMRLLAVRDRPSVATRAVSPITIPMIVNSVRWGLKNKPDAAVPQPRALAVIERGGHRLPILARQQRRHRRPQAC